jgi:hypothetical protein
LFASRRAPISGRTIAVRVPIGVDARLFDDERIERLADRRQTIGDRVARSFD